MHNVLKKLVWVAALILLPFVIVAIFGAIYIAVRMIGGVGLMAAVGAFMGLIRALVPYFPYLTGIPMVLVAAAVLMKSRGKAEKGNIRN